MANSKLCAVTNVASNQGNKSFYVSVDPPPGIDVEVYNAPGSYHGADPEDPRTFMQAQRVYMESLNAALNPAA